MDFHHCSPLPVSVFVFACPPKLFLALENGVSGELRTLNASTLLGRMAQVGTFLDSRLSFLGCSTYLNVHGWLLLCVVQ